MLRKGFHAIFVAVSTRGCLLPVLFAHPALHLGQVTQTRVYKPVKEFTEHVLSLLSNVSRRLFPASRAFALFPCCASIIPRLGAKVQCENDGF